MRDVAADRQPGSDRQAVAPGRSLPDQRTRGARPQGRPSPPLHAQVYALCSYLVGMEVPGLRSLFTRAAIAFADEVDAREELLYRLEVERVDESFRLLDARGGRRRHGRTVARHVHAAQLRPVQPCRHGSRSHARPGAEPRRPAPGTSRSWSAAVVASEPTSQPRWPWPAPVCSSATTTMRRAPTRLRDRLGALGHAVDLLQGDAGDPAWCDAAVSAIVRTAGSLDLLVLNACAPPTPLVDRSGVGDAVTGLPATELRARPGAAGRGAARAAGSRGRRDVRVLVVRRRASTQVRALRRAQAGRRSARDDGRARSAGTPRAHPASAATADGVERHADRRGWHDRIRACRGGLRQGSELDRRRTRRDRRRTSHRSNARSSRPTRRR